MLESNINHIPEKTSKSKTESVNDSNHKRGLTDKQKKAIKIGAAAVATALAVYGGYRLAKSGKLDGVINKGRSALNKLHTGGLTVSDAKDGFDLQKYQSSVKENLRKVNPKFSQLKPKSYMNCGNCSIAFEARMRGYDVTARGNDTGMRLSQFGEMFKGFNSNSFHTVDLGLDLPKNASEKSKVVRNAVKSSISKAYNGDARGTIFFTHERGSHFFSWIKQGNDVRFYDAQNPDCNIDQLFSMYKRHTGSSSSVQTTILRLDDLEMNTQNLKRVIKNVSDRSSINSDSFDTWVSRGQNFVMY